MLSKDTIFKSFLRPGLTTINGITYVVPGWHVVPEGTSLEEVNKHWIREEHTGGKSVFFDHKISETIISQRTGEAYNVEFSGHYWSCTCVGFSFRGKCKHIENIKQKYIK